MRKHSQDGGTSRRHSVSGAAVADGREPQIHHSIVMQTAAKKLGELSHKLGANSWSSSLWMYHALARVPAMVESCPVKLPATLIFVDGDPVEWISMSKKGTSVKLEPASEASIEKFVRFCQLELVQSGGVDSDQAVCNMMTSTFEGIKVQGVPMRTLQELVKELSVNRKHIFALQAVVCSPILFTRGVATVHENLFLRQQGGIFRHTCSTVKYLIPSQRSEDNSAQKDSANSGVGARPTLTRMNSQVDGTEDSNVREPIKVKDLLSSKKVLAMNPKVSSKLTKILESYCGVTKKSLSSDKNQNKRFDEITKTIVHALERAYDMWVLSIAVHYILDSKGHIWLHKISRVHTVRRKDWDELHVDDAVLELLSPKKMRDEPDLSKNTSDIPIRLIDNAIAALRQQPEMRQSLDLQSILPILSFCPLLSRISHTFRVNLARNSMMRVCACGDMLPTNEQIENDTGCLWIILSGKFSCDVDKYQSDHGMTGRERSVNFAALDCFGENYLITSELGAKSKGTFHCTNDGIVLEISSEIFYRIQDSLLKSGACIEKLSSAFTAVQRATLRRVMVATASMPICHRDLRIGMDLLSTIPFFQNLPRLQKEFFLNSSEYMSFNADNISEMMNMHGMHCILKGTLKISFENGVSCLIGPPESIYLEIESKVVSLECDGTVESVHISNAQLFPTPVLRPGSVKRCVSPGWIEMKLAQRPPQRILPRMGLSPKLLSTKDDDEVEQLDFIAKNLSRPAVKTTNCKLCKCNIATGYDREDTVTVALVCKSALHMQSRGPVHPAISPFARADISQVDAGKELGLVSTQSMQVCYTCYRILMFEQNLMCQEELFARILVGTGYQSQYESALQVKSAKLLCFYLKIDKFLGVGEELYRLGKLQIKCIALGTSIILPFPTIQQQKEDAFKECRCFWFFGNSTPLLQYLNSVHDLRISIQTCATSSNKEELEIADVTISMLHIAEKIAMNHEFRLAMGTNFKNIAAVSNTCSLQVKGSFGLQKYNEVNIKELDLEHKQGLYFPRNTFVTEASPPDGWSPLNMDVLTKIRNEVASKWGPKLTHNAIRGDGQLLPMSTFVKSDAPLCLHQEWTSRNPIQMRAKSPLKQMLKEMEQVQIHSATRTKMRPQSAHNLRSTFQRGERATTSFDSVTRPLAESQENYETDKLNLMSDESSDSEDELLGNAAIRTQQRVRAANAAFSNRASKIMEASKLHVNMREQQQDKVSNDFGASESSLHGGKNEGHLASRSSTQSIGDRISRNIASHNAIGTGILGFSHPTNGVPDEVL
jgi:hypothetical protein